MENMYEKKMNEKDSSLEEGEEQTNEPQIKYPGIKSMPYIIGNETFEKLGAIGTISNLLVYLTTVFNFKHITATTLLNVFSGTTNFVTLIGAFLCDTYFGRYKTLAFSSIASFLGLLLVSLTAAIKNLHPPKCGVRESECIGPTPTQIVVLLSGFGLMVVGAGGIRPCNLAFGADQFNPNTETGKRGIKSFFNWYYLTITFAQMVSVTLVVYIQTDISWAIGLGIPAIFMLISCVLFFAAKHLYVIVKPEGSPLKSIAQVVVAAAKKRRLKLPEQPALYNYTSVKSINSKLSYTHQFRFLDKAAIISSQDEIKEDGTASDPWRLASIQQIEEAKCVLKVLPILTAALIYHIAITQQQQYVVFQALQSDRHLGKTKFQIPAATYTIFSMLSLTIWVPIYDRVVVPLIRRVTKREGGITLLQRMGIGIFLAVVASLVSAFVEQRRRAAPTLGVHSARGVVSSMNALWLVPQLLLAGLAEAFCAIGQVEFYYKQFPENMRSFAGSLFFVGWAVSSYLNGALLSVVHHATGGSSSHGNWLPEDLNKGRLDYFYFLITALGVLNVAYFVACAKWYRYKGEEE